MKVTLNRKIILVASCLLLVSCAGETQAQIDSDKQGLLSASGIEIVAQQCETHKKETGLPYQIISGRAIMAEISPVSTYDCFGRSDCKMPTETEFFAVMHPSMIVEKSISEEFYIYTKKEKIENLYKSSPYMEKGKTYVFCGVKITDLELKRMNSRLQGKNVYRIDFTETIRRIE